MFYNIYSTFIQIEQIVIRLYYKQRSQEGVV